MARVSEGASIPIPRKGRLRVVLLLAVGLVALGYAIVSISTREAGSEVVRVEGVGAAQRIFGGQQQAGDRLGSPDAPVTIQVFNDLQCRNCREAFLAVVPTLAEEYVRPGEAKLLMRHYSVARRQLELGFFGAEAAAEQGYGWQFTYLFFVNQDEAERFGVGDRFMGSLAASIGDLDVPLWQQVFDEESEAEGPLARRLEASDELGRQLGIRLGQALVISGPRGTRVVQDGAGLARVEAAIAAVR